ncbi:MAG: hypothetical protein J5762_05795 [Clostridia bacterium]|nr:hypothetical protein [Clostridia bacterium]
MKKIRFLTVIIVIFAIAAIFCGAYVFYRNTEVFKKVNGVGFMTIDIKGLSEKDAAQYAELKAELDEKYLVKFCDIMDEAKADLISSSENALGEEYLQKKKHIEDERKNAEDLAKRLVESDELKSLKDKLVVLKEELIKAPTEDEKEEVKAEAKGVLAEITRITLNNFKIMSDKKKEIDDLTEELKIIVNENKDKISVVEKDIIEKSQRSMREMLYSYGSEAEALANAFGLVQFDRKPAFIDKINPEARLASFDRNTLLDALNKNKHDHVHHEHHDHGETIKKQPSCSLLSSCDKDSCAGCSSATERKNEPTDKDSDDDTTFYDAKIIDNNNN